MEITYGQYAMPVVLTVFLAFIYKAAGDAIPDRIKPLLAVVIGVGLGVLWIPYNGLDWTIKAIVDNAIYGFMVGCSSVGIYELQRSATRPRD